MSMPHKAVSALVCVVVAFVLGFVARLPALMERLEPQVRTPDYEMNLSNAPATAGPAAWREGIPLTRH